MMSKENNNQSVSEWFVNHLPFNVIWINQNAEIVFANQSFYKTFNYNEIQIKAVTMYDINPSLTPETWEQHWEIVKAKKVDHFKTTHRKKNGKAHSVEVIAHFFSNNGKELICSVIRDISDSVYYKRILEKTENAVSVGGWKWNLIDDTVLASKVALCIFDLEEPRDLLPANILQRFLHPEKIKTAFRSLIRDEISYDLTLRVMDKNKAMKWIRCIASPECKNGKIEKVYGTYQDVTEQKNREYLLELSRRIIDNAQDIIFIWEQSGQLFRFNESAIRELGFSKEELNTTTIYDLDASITPEWWANHFEEIINQKSMTFEWVATRKNNTKFPVEITANLVQYGGRNLNCAILRNITGRKEREVKLREALEEIKQLKTQLEIENEYLQEEIKLDHNFEEIISKSKSYKSILQKIEKVAPTESTILITGESGTGKELLARAAHQLSSRNDKPLIKVNCAALPKALIESELFGHKKGAFTGAISNKVGKFELANNGTIFLDEIGELPIELQPKLLRVLQEGELDRLGDTETTKVNIRVIAATNRDLEKMVEAKEFREDLFYRLNVFPIYNIPLRQRKEDIPMLAQFFLGKYNVKSGKSFKRVSKKVIEGFKKYDFPGNIRELENIIERGVIIESGTTLFPGDWMPNNKSIKKTKEQFMTFEALQKAHILEVLFHTKWRVSGEKGAAKILGLKDKTLFAKMNKLGIKKEDYLKK
ncbi:MAG: sigma 54-interacting transcriptional regulator [Bacteroidota bacterium]